MPRYLTPNRVCLLVLVEQYLESQLAANSRLQVLSFISRRISTPTEGKHTTTFLDSIDGEASPAFDSLTHLASDVPGRSVYDAFLQRIWVVSGLDDLQVLFERLATRIPSAPVGEGNQRGLSRHGPMSQYIRRCCVEFTRLPFADTQNLFQAFVQFRASTYDAWAQRNPESAARLKGQQVSADATPTEISAQVDGGAQQIASADDAATLLSFSINQLQKLGTRLDGEVKHRLQQWMLSHSDSATQPLQHFLAFFEHWKGGEYSMALESLHRYFDYSLAAKGTGGASENMRVYYQYALLHLSVLHADFECWEDSIDAMNECIATARENQDVACLNFALSWLLYLRQSQPASQKASFGAVSGMLGSAMSQTDELAFLKAKARESKNWSLLSSTLLEEAKHEMYHSGVSVRAIEHITQASYLNVQHDLRTLMPAASLFEGASFDRLGQAHLTARAHDTVTAVYEEEAPLSDRVRSACSNALRMAQNGRVSSAMELLDGITPQLHGVLKLERKVTVFKLLVQITQSLRRNDFHAARHYSADLRPLRDSGDDDVDFEIRMLEVNCDMKQQRFESALHSTNSFITQLKASPGDGIARRLRLLILKSRIFISSGQPAKAFSTALRAASTAERLRLMPLLLDALQALATILNHLSGFSVAKGLLEAVLPKMLELRQPQLTGRAFVTLGESHIGLAGQASPLEEPGRERSQYCRNAERYFERALEVFQSINDIDGILDCLAIKAHLARWKSDESSAAQADGVYLQLLADEDTARTVIC